MSSWWLDKLANWSENQKCIPLIPFIHKFPPVSVLVQLDSGVRTKAALLNYIIHTKCIKKHYLKLFQIA